MNDECGGSHHAPGRYTATSSASPAREVVAGKQAVSGWFADWFRQFDPDYRFKIKEVRDFGDRILVVGIHHVARTEQWSPGRAPVGVGVHGARPQVYRVEIWADRDAALEAAGLSE